MRYLVLFLLVTLSLSGLAQTREGVEVDLDGQPLVPADNTQEGDLNSNTQVGGNNVEGSYNSSKTYNGAGSSGMPVNTAISPSLMSSGTESCLQSVTGGVQLVGLGLSSGKYMQDTSEIEDGTVLRHPTWNEGSSKPDVPESQRLESKCLCLLLLALSSKMVSW